MGWCLLESVIVTLGLLDNALAEGTDGFVPMTITGPNGSTIAMGFPI